MEQPILDAIVVGAGQAGLCTSYFLKQHGLQHIVFERGRTGDSWRSQRWDSFRLNSPNQFNLVADVAFKLPHGEFATATEFAEMLDQFADKHQLPVLEKVKVISIEKSTDNDVFTIAVETMDQRQVYYSRQVIIASGAQNEKKLPSFAGRVSGDVLQLHTTDYRNARQLKDGAVLVAGSGQSGIQIVEDLLEAGRKVYFSTSLVGRVPRTYRGRDIIDWLLFLKFFDARIQDIDPAMLNMKPPQLTGVGTNRTISLQLLAKKGAIIIGKTENGLGKTIALQLNAAQHVQFADQTSQTIKSMIDEAIAKNNIDAPVAAPDEADAPDSDADCVTNIASLNLEEHQISNIIWATGFNCNFRYIRLPVLDDQGMPVHDNGISAVEGLYFTGIPWLRSRKSSLIYGAKEDAEFIAEKVYNHSLALQAT